MRTRLGALPAQGFGADAALSLAEVGGEAVYGGALHGRGDVGVQVPSRAMGSFVRKRGSRLYG